MNFILTFAMIVVVKNIFEAIYVGHLGWKGLEIVLVISTDMALIRIEIWFFFYHLYLETPSPHKNCQIYWLKVAFLENGHDAHKFKLFPANICDLGPRIDMYWI